jgi:predicted esterase
MGNLLNLFYFKPLVPMGARSDTITISGFSSGSMMSMTLHVIYSETFKGAGLLMGESYYTPDYDDDVEVISDENLPLEEMTANSIEKAEEYFGDGLIDDLDNLQGAPVFILSGLVDDVVPPKMQQSQRDFYLNFGADVTYEEEEYTHNIPIDNPN